MREWWVVRAASVGDARACVYRWPHSSLTGRAYLTSHGSRDDNGLPRVYIREVLGRENNTGKLIVKPPKRRPVKLKRRRRKPAPIVLPKVRRTVLD